MKGGLLLVLGLVSVVVMSIMVGAINYPPYRDYVWTGYHDGLDIVMEDPDSSNRLNISFDGLDISHVYLDRLWQSMLNLSSYPNINELFFFNSEFNKLDYNGVTYMGISEGYGTYNGESNLQEPCGNYDVEEWNFEVDYEFVSDITIKDEHIRIKASYLVRLDSETKKVLKDCSRAEYTILFSQSTYGDRISKIEDDLFDIPPTSNCSGDVCLDVCVSDEFGCCLEGSESGRTKDKIKWLKYQLCHNIASFDSWKQSIDLTIQATETQLESVKQWLFFWNYQGEEENVCDAIENECGGTNCTNECSQGSKGCTDSNTKWSCQLQNDGCYDKIEVSCGDGFECIDGDCVPLQAEQEVIFRTNAVNGDYKSGTWIAVDTNNNCGLEGYDYSGSTGILSSCKGTLLVNSPEGYGVYLYSGKVYVCVPSGTKFAYKKYYSSSTTAVTSSSQTEPYASNNQEVYGECTPS